VSDGTPGEPGVLEVKARAGYRVEAVPTPPPSSAATNAGGVMIPVENDRLARVLTVGKPGRYTLCVRALAGADSPMATCEAQLRPGRSYAAVFDPQTRKLTIEEGTWTAFCYRVADDAGLPADTPVRAVAIAGSFNGWSPSATPMTETGDGEFCAALRLPEGLHHYKFVVNGLLWREDPKADPRWRISDEHEGYNSGVFVGPHGEDYGPPRPDHIETDAFFHDPSQVSYFNVIGDDLIEVRCRTLANDVQQVALIATAPRNPEPGTRNPSLHRWPMQKTRTQYGFDYWAVRVADPPVTDGGFQYVFEARDGRAVAMLPPPGTRPAEFRRPLRPSFRTPEWARDAVWYQILVSRFRNGDPTNDPVPRVPWTWNWLKPFGREAEIDPHGGSNAYYRYVWFRHYGGDIAGLREKLPYLRDLGISAIYFNPLFEAASNHRYDTADYKHIDPVLGDNETFRRLCEEAKKMGIAVILDGVFSHTGSDSIYFNKEGRYPGPGAYQSTASPYFPWYRFRRHPDDYESWWGVDALPNVNELEPSYLDFIVGEDGVARHWLRLGAKGWRLDVADELPDRFIRELR
ncbi:MAG TPA: alpha amylase N-terminal ig-like domain-containing protein, partial [Phycisphaerae bacterium]|nr:alpha amylase N-terminal ig-like domain-containing protein [Phycisphaerae bacterium]